MNKELTTRQVCCMIAISIISLKFLIFPALFSKFAFRDCYFAVIISLIIDFTFFAIVVWFMKNNPNLSMKDALMKAFGKTFMRIVMFILFFYFFFKSILIIKETHNYFIEVLFEELNWFYFIIPLFILLAYIMYKNLRTMGRSIEIFFPFIVIGIILTVLLPLRDFSFINLFPMFENGVEPIFNAVLRCNYSFGDYLVLMIFMGKIKYEKGSLKKLINYVIITDLFVAAFYVIFVAVFDITAINQGLAVSDLPLHVSYPSTIGRLDWLTIIIWTITLIFQAGVLLSCAVETLKSATMLNSKIEVIGIIEILMVISVIIFYLNLARSINIIVSTTFAIISVAVQVSIPILLIIAHFVLKKNGVNETTIVNTVQRPILKTMETKLLPAKLNKKTASVQFFNNLGVPSSLPPSLKGKRYEIN